MTVEDLAALGRRQVERAVLNSTALVVVVSDGTATVPEQGVSLDRVSDLQAAGCEVVQLPWSADHPERSYRVLDEITSFSAARTVASVIDIDLPAPDHAHHAAELAWHAGYTVVLRLDERTLDLVDPHPDARAAVAHADIVVAPHEVQEALRAAAATVLPALVETFDVRDLMHALGPLSPPKPDLSMTVLVTTYARRSELASCLESLTRQTLGTEHFDVVVVDDASPEDVTPVIQSMHGRLRTTLITLPVNSGPAAARAAGVAAATGDVVMLLDDDDVLAPRALAEHIRAHTAHAEEHVAVLGHTVVRPSGAPTVLSRHVTRTGHQYFDYGSFRAGTVLGWAGFWAGRISAKRTLLARHSFRGTFMEDTDFAWRADAELSARGTPLEVHYAREAVQVMASPLDLAGMRRRQVKMGWVSHDFQDEVGLSWQAQRDAFLSALTVRPGLPVRVLEDLPVRAGESLLKRRSTTSSRASAAGFQRVDGLLKVDLTAHEGSGFMAAARVAELRREGRTPALAVDGLDPGAVAAIATTNVGDDIHLIVTLPEDPQYASLLTSTLHETLDAQGRRLEDIGDVDLRPGATLASVCAVVDFVVDVHGELSYRDGAALPLLCLSASEWVERLARPSTASGSLH